MVPPSCFSNCWGSRTIGNPVLTPKDNYPSPHPHVCTNKYQLCRIDCDLHIIALCIWVYNRNKGLIAFSPLFSLFRSWAAENKPVLLWFLCAPMSVAAASRGILGAAGSVLSIALGNISPGPGLLEPAREPERGALTGLLVTRIRPTSSTPARASGRCSAPSRLRSWFWSSPRRKPGRGEETQR